MVGPILDSKHKAHLSIPIVVIFVISCINGKPTEGQVRLVDGDIKGSGRVEIYHDNKWGTVCDDYWDLNDANVVCQQLGFKREVSAGTSTRSGSGQIWLDNVRCKGNEMGLAGCANNGWGANNCDHSEDAAVECQVEDIVTDIRLVHESGKENPLEGVLEIFKGNKWTPLCDFPWGTTEAEVVCRQLGFISATNYVRSKSADVRSISYDFNCTGYELSLRTCSHRELSSIPNCKREDGIRVTCINYYADSVTDEYLNPNKYIWTDWFSTGSTEFQGSQLTLDAIRNSFNVCVGAIPADIECRTQTNANVACNRRQDLICNPDERQDCDTYEVRLLCTINDRFTRFVTCTFEGLEYAPGEERPDSSICRECTCFDDGEWRCGDYDESFCAPELLSCNRPCDEAPFNRTCLLPDWVIEWFYAGESSFCDGCLYNVSSVNQSYAMPDEKTCPNCIPVDGVPRAVAVINRNLPGPAVQVCEGDRIVVKVVNKMKYEAATGNSIHWHGMFMGGTQYMDGAFMITQCPIPIGEAFIYDFHAIPHGTHWWHSHAGLQRGDGVNGALVVRQPKNEDPNKDHYDEDRHDHVIVVQDWSHRLSVTEFNRDMFGNFNVKPSTILINGRSAQTTPKADRPKLCGKEQKEECPVPRYSQFDITEGLSYRFRMISSATHRACAMRVSIDQHNITIIAADGASVKPFTCKSFIIFNAERYDFVVSANQPPGDYWMRVQGMHLCDGISGMAIIHYNTTNRVDIPVSEDDSSTGIKVDSCGINDPNTEPLYELNSAEPNDMDDWNSETPDVTYYIGLELGDLPQLNNMTFRLPSRPFLLQTSDAVEKEEVCNLENRELEGHKGEMEICGEGFCDCSHVINIKLGQVVELVFVNEGNGACHPMHLHGNYYRVVAEESFPSKSNITSGVQYVRKLNENKEIQKKEISKSIQKDTMVAPANGFTVVQFRASNPGWWFFHCHYEMHQALGMTSVIHVGTEEDLPPIPDTFPSCGNWPVDRRGNAQVFDWSEERLGDIDRTKNKFFMAVGQKLDKTKRLLEGIRNNAFTTFTVSIHRIKTDPTSKDTGVHSYLFKVNTGNYNYVHLQFETPAREENPKPKLIACYVDQSAQSSLIPLKACSIENVCPKSCNNRAALPSSAPELQCKSILLAILLNVCVGLWNLII